MKKVLERIKSKLRCAKSAIVASHLDPDGDAIGSMLALGFLLEKKGLEVTCYLEDGVPRIYRFLPGAEKVKSEIFPQRHYDLAFVVDSSDLSRIGDKINLREIAPVIINIDHHPDNTNFGDVNFIYKTSSVAEQIFYLYRFLKVKIDKIVAECLYTAMITDTGNFRYENTTSQTFSVAAELIKAGVNTHELTTRIYDTRSLASIRIESMVLSQLKFTEDHKVAWGVAREEMIKETGAKGEDLIGIVDRIRSISGVEVAIFFRQEKEQIKVNLRSKEKVKVSEIAKRLGGGGHFKAAGVVLKGEVDQVVEKVVSETKKYLEGLKYLA